MSGGEENPSRRVCVCVLGDLGRSPRMQYHTMSLIREGFAVDVVGYEGARLQPEIMNSSNISVHHLKPCPDFNKYVPRLVCYILKVLWQAFVLFWTLLRIPPFSHLLVQNPPSVPSLPVCWLVARLRFSRIVVDWHNYGHTVLALSLSHSHPLVVVARWLEHQFGRRADSGFCVTSAMREDLAKLGVSAVTLYDRPPSIFQSLSIVAKHEFLMKMSDSYQAFSTTAPNKSSFTERFADGRVELLEDRPGLLVSSTSWTEDEDFSILIRALEDYEKVRTLFPDNYPPLVVAVTGRGLLKDFYCDIINGKEWQHVEICTPWLEPEDYPKLLACADLGVCLHTSTSGLDLPMKVVDMFGCGLPVCAFSFKCLGELVRHGENGFVFETSAELANQIQDWFRGFPKQCLDEGVMFRENIKPFQMVRWHDSWRTNALSFFL